MSRFVDRREAGRILAKGLLKYEGRPDVIVLALPRGGVPVAYEIAHALQAPLDVFTVRKIGHPLHEEVALGAIATGGVQYLDRSAMSHLGISETMLKPTITRERRELERRERLYRDERPLPDVLGKTVILVDDGLATGASARSAVAALRSQLPAAIIVATPISSRDACSLLGSIADECVCVELPEPFYGVGLWYYDFDETSDDQVLTLLRRANDELRQPVSA